MILFFHSVPKERVRCSHSTASIDKWLVGSSSSSTSGLAKSAEASATLTRQPPERSFIFLLRSSSENPSETSMLLARPSAPSESIMCSFSCTEAISMAAAPASSSSLPLDLSSSSAKSDSRASLSTSAASTMSRGCRPSFMTASGISCAT
mmetsp:Transcript_41752/g.104347  ORF Transcript_41752/g.104347 Transcript_41752/m.104347 type:complete len:150 (-) Transcript_41752:802-1251(-)